MANRRVFNAHESYISSLSVRVICELFDLIGSGFKENGYSRQEIKQKAEKYFTRLCEQSDNHNYAAIVCEKYNCSFKIQFFDDGKYVLSLRTECNKKRSPFSLKELAMVKVTQQISIYELDTLFWIYSRFLVDISFHAGDEWSRTVWSVKRIIMQQIHRRLYPNQYGF